MIAQGREGARDTGPLGWLACVLLLLAGLAWVDALRFADPDLFVHLYSGREIAAHGGPPGIDTASFSVPGEPWNDYEWLARLVFFRLVAGFGAGGLVAIRAGLIGVTLLSALVVAARHRGGPLAFGIAGCTFLVAASPYAHFRPQLFTFAFYAALLALIDVAREGRRWPLFAVPLGMPLWVNLHGGWGIGVAAMVCLAAEATATRLVVRTGRKVPWAGRTAFLPAIVSLAATAAATGLNPYGYRIWGAVFGTLFGEFTPMISEWKALTAYPLSATWGAYLAFAIVAAVMALAWRRLGPYDLLLVLSVVAGSWSRVRFVPLLGIVGALTVARLLPGVLARRADGARAALRGSAAAAAAALILAVSLARGGFRDTAIWKEEWYTPVAAVAFLEANGLDAPTRIFTDYDWGGYVRYRIPGAAIFVDGRSDTVYPYAVIEEWTRCVDGDPDAYDVPERYGARMIVLRREHPVVRRLEADERWINAYADETTAIFFLDDPDNAALVERLEAGVVAPPPGSVDYRLDAGPPEPPRSGAMAGSA